MQPAPSCSVPRCCPGCTNQKPTLPPAQPSVTAPPGSLAARPAPVCATRQAHNLIKAGYDVTVWNRSSDKCEPLAKAGAKVRSGDL